MTNFKIVEDVHSVTGEITQYVIIDLGNEVYRSMPKAVWDELEAKREQSGRLS